MNNALKYYDIRSIRPDIQKGENNYYINGCTEKMQTAPSQWGEMPYCPKHGIRIHPSTNTFVYYNGDDRTSKRTAALRNIKFNKEFFSKYVLGNAYKAESHRICHETSEDALTWNVFSEILSRGLLEELVRELVGIEVIDPKLILWGLEIDLKSKFANKFAPLNHARKVFEPGVTRFFTEPDIIIHAEGKQLILIEAKFTSGNTIAKTNYSNDSIGEKPKTKEGIIERYSEKLLPKGSILPDKHHGAFYSQLYRNLVFAIHMANELCVEWHLCNLISEKQVSKHLRSKEYLDPTSFLHSVLPINRRNRFHRISWEDIYRKIIRRHSELSLLNNYMFYKSANSEKAFNI